VSAPAAANSPAGHKRREEYLLAFEIAHFLMDVVIVIHIVVTMVS